jgi:hypothetical protein
MPAVENSLGPCREPKSTISGWTLARLYPEMVFLLAQLDPYLIFYHGHCSIIFTQ